MTTVVNGLTIEERALSPFDLHHGIVRRWKVATPNALRYVILTKPGPGRWAGPATYLCSCGVAGCDHVVAIRQLVEPPPRAA